MPAAMGCCVVSFVSPDALVDSATGSRILEVAVTMLTPERFQMVFAHWMVKKINHLAQGNSADGVTIAGSGRDIALNWTQGEKWFYLADGAAGRFGNFVLQKVLQSPVFQAAHLKQFVQGTRFIAAECVLCLGVANCLALGLLL